MRTKEEVIKEANELLLKLEVFDCEGIYCIECPFDSNQTRGTPTPDWECMPNHARHQRDWLRSSNTKANKDE